MSGSVHKQYIVPFVYLKKKIDIPTVQWIHQTSSYDTVGTVKYFNQHIIVDFIYWAL